MAFTKAFSTGNHLMVAAVPIIIITRRLWQGCPALHPSKSAGAQGVTLFKREQREPDANHEAVTIQRATISNTPQSHEE